jgi:hypothetical protein
MRHLDTGFWFIRKKFVFLLVFQKTQMVNARILILQTRIHVHTDPSFPRLDFVFPYMHIRTKHKC